MFYERHIPGTEWMAIYILWICGILIFWLIATSARDPVQIVHEHMTNWLGRTIVVWTALSVVAGSMLWPLIFAGPIMMVTLGGAPLSAGIVSAGFTIFNFYLLGKMLEERRRPVRITHS